MCICLGFTLFELKMKYSVCGKTIKSNQTLPKLNMVLHEEWDRKLTRHWGTHGRNPAMFDKKITFVTSCFFCVFFFGCFVLFLFCFFVLFFFLFFFCFVLCCCFFFVLFCCVFFFLLFFFCTPPSEMVSTLKGRLFALKRSKFFHF